MCTIITRPPALVFLGLFCVTALHAQPSQPTTITLTAVPRLVRVGSSFHPANGSAPVALENATLAIYAEETGGTALWQETQNVPLDSDGHYSVLLGSTRNEGLPLELFAFGEPRWLGVQFQRPGEAEKPRVLLASVPYALKAADADTLGGLPASAYLRTEPVTGLGEGAAAKSEITAAKVAVPRITSGTTNSIAKFVNTTDLGNSVMFENAGMIGLGTTSPLDFMHVKYTNTNGTLTGYAVQNLGNTATSYSGMLFYDQFGALGQFQGFNNVTHEYRINNIAKNGMMAFDGSINFMIASNSKFLVRSDGDVDVPGSMRKGGTLFLHNLGSNTTAVGLGALAVNSGGSNTALGSGALQTNTSGNNNTASGAGALQANTTGLRNTATGTGALASNSVGQFNNAFGAFSLDNNTMGSSNNAFGDSALEFNTGGSNTAFGDSALVLNTTGSGNTALGADAGSSLTTGANNTALGVNAGDNLTSGSHNIMIGNEGLSTDDHIIRIGDVQNKTFIAGIRGVTTGTAIPVLIDSNGQLGTTSSSRRFKEDIHDMGDVSSNLLRLRPVTYRYKQPYADGSKPLDYGLIAEEVAEVYPDLVVRGKDGHVETVQYQKLTPMLLNELQKQNQHCQQQDETIRQQHSEIEALKAKLAGMSALEAKLALMSALEARLAALEALLSGHVAATATAGQ